MSTAVKPKTARATKRELFAELREGMTALAKARAPRLGRVIVLIPIYDSFAYRRAKSHA